MNGDSGRRQFQYGSCQGLNTIPENLPTTTTPLKDTDNGIFRMIDAVYIVDDQITGEIANNSEVGGLLDRFTWTDKLGAGIKGSIATLRLRWSSEVKPKLQIEKVICWVFLGVGCDPLNFSDTSKLADPSPH